MESLASLGIYAAGSPLPNALHKAAVVRDGCIAAGRVLAARDMAAEGCRAAVLDRRHDLQLAEANMAGIGRTPCRPVAAEDIRDLQGRTGHDRGQLGRRLCFLTALPGFL
jgi:hypothetical protein